MIFIDMKLGEALNEVNNEIQFVTKGDEDRVTISAVRDGEVLGAIVLEFVFSGYWEFEDELSEDEYYELFPDDKFAKIEDLRVDNKFRGEGVAKLLMIKAIETVKGQGWDIIFLNASPIGFGGLDVNGLVNFYGKFGFEIPPYLGNWDENKEMILRL